MEQETKTYFLKNCISFGNENMTKKEEMEIKKEETLIDYSQKKTSSHYQLPPPYLQLFRH